MHIVLATAFLCDTPWDIPGGGMGEYVTKIARLLIDSGNKVEIVAGALNDLVWEYKGIKVYNAFWYGNLNGNIFQVSEAILSRNIAIQKCIRLIDKQDRVDIVQYAGWSGIGMMHSIKCPAILRLSTYSKVTYSQNVIYRKNAKIYSFWERMAAKFADRIICPGIQIAKIFGKECNKSVEIVETPVDVDIEKRDNIVYEKLKRKKYILFFGTASKEKGFDVIGDMCVSLFKHNKEINFVCAGWDEGQGNNSAVHRLRDKLEEESHRFIYLGPLDKYKLYPVIEGSIMVLVPSLADNLPNACLEAMALGKIVIGTKGTALEQLIKDKINGFLVKPGDSNDLFDTVSKVIELTDERKKNIEKKALESMKPYYPQNSVKKLLKIYKEEVNKQ